MSYASSGGAITVTDKDSDSFYQTDAEVNGMYWPKNNQILLFSHGNRSSLLHSVEGTARHELGHFIYDELVSDADLRSLKQLFKTDELKSFIRTTGRTDARDSSGEYFAELISYMAFYGWNEACDAFPESVAIAAYYLELERPCETLPAA